MENTCFFFGHRDAPEELLNLLIEVVAHHITEYGVTEFIAGDYGRFDVLARRAVNLVKKQYPNVRMIYLRPYHPVERPDTPSGFDGSFYPPGMETVPRRVAIVRANRYMIDHTPYLIAYCCKIGNVWKMMDHARYRERKGLLHIENVADSSTVAQTR